MTAGKYYKFKLKLNVNLRCIKHFVNIFHDCMEDYEMWCCIRIDINEILNKREANVCTII